MIVINDSTRKLFSLLGGCASDQTHLTNCLIDHFFHSEQVKSSEFLQTGIQGFLQQAKSKDNTIELMSYLDELSKAHTAFGIVKERLYHVLKYSDITKLLAKPRLESNLDVEVFLEKLRVLESESKAFNTTNIPSSNPFIIYEKDIIVNIESALKNGRLQIVENLNGGLDFDFRNGYYCIPSKEYKDYLTRLSNFRFVYSVDINNYYFLSNHSKMVEDKLKALKESFNQNLIKSFLIYCEVEEEIKPFLSYKELGKSFKKHLNIDGKIHEYRDTQNEALFYAKAGIYNIEDADGLYILARAMSEADSIKWYHKAAKQGHKEAQMYFGQYLLIECRVENKNIRSEARYWLQKAEEGDDVQPKTHYDVGNIWERSGGELEDLEEAVKCYERAKAHKEAVPAFRSKVDKTLEETRGKIREKSKPTQIEEDKTSNAQLVHSSKKRTESTKEKTGLISKFFKLF